MQTWNRTKDQFKTAKGKYVTPTPIENTLAANTLIEQCCVVGSELPQPVALIVLAEETGLSQETIKAELEKTLQQTNANLESHQKLAHLIVLGESFNPDNDLLTATLKLRRDKIETRYDALVRQTLPERIVWESDL